MNHWKVVLNTGEIVEEGLGVWVETPGQPLPWRRLCAYLTKEGKWIDTLFIVTPLGDINISTMGEKDPLFYSIQNDVVVDNVLGDSTMTDTLHVASHYENDVVVHTYYNDEGLSSFSVLQEEYKPLVPSPGKP